MNPSILLLVLACSGDKGSDTVPLDGGSSDGGVSDGGVSDGGVSDGGTTDGGTEPVFQEPAIITVESAVSTLAADGRSSLLLGLQVADAAGVPAPIGTELGLDASLGSLGEVEWSEDGVATITFTAGTWPGEALLSTTSEEPLAGLDRIALITPPGHTSQLHTHGSLSEREGTMLSHTLLGEEQDLDVIWWTDHDQRYHPDGYAEIDTLDFEAEELPSADGPTDAGWYAQTRNMRVETFATRTAAAYGGDRGLYIYVQSDVLSTADDPDHATWEYQVGDQTNFKSLLGEVSVEFYVRAALDNLNTELFIIIPFSAKGVSAREGDYRSLVLYSSSETYVSDDWTIYQPIEVNERSWTHVDIQLSDLAREKWPEPGADMHAELITFQARSHSGGTGGWYIDEVYFPMEVNGPELRAAQREYLDSLPSHIVHHIGLELSHVTDGHGGAFWPTDEWSFMPYTAPNVLLFSDAVAQIHSEGGIVAYNHVFGTLSYYYSEAELDEKIEDAIEMFVENDMFGVDLLEVGYRTRGGGLEHFMEVWDRLGHEHGFFVTGIGTSDQHHLDLGRAGNNFVTFIGAASSNGQDLVDALRRGHAWFGDPDYFVGTELVTTLQVPDHQAVMGQVISGATEPTEVVFTASALQTGWTVVSIIDGEQIGYWTVKSDGAFEATQAVDPLQDRVVRFEVHHPDAEEILYTNPVYFVEAGVEVPVERVPAP